LARRRKNRNRVADLLIVAVPLGALWFHLRPEAAALLNISLLGLGAVAVGIMAAFVVRRQSGRRAGRSPSLPWRAPAAGVDQRLEQTSSDKTPSAWSLQLIRMLEWKRFEELAAAYFRAKGYRVEPTGPGPDGGIDFYLYARDVNPPKLLSVAQCKAWNSGSIGVRHIRELFGIMNDAGCPLGIFICTTSFTPEARRFAEGKRIQLINAARLLELIQSTPEQDQRSMLELVTRGDFRTPSCPRCGTKLVLRTARKDKGAGSQFWGCSRFPRCRYTMGSKRAALE
jgi:hypothetical protein